MTLDLANVRADVKIRGMDIGLFRGVWPLDGWDYRRKVTITEQSGEDLTDYQVLVELDSSNFDFTHAQSNGEDVRFADTEGNLFDYWIEEWDSVNETAKVWVKVPSIPANGTTELYMYYGNPSASSESDGDATFEFFDDFESGGLEKWEVMCGTWEITTYDGGNRLKGSNCGDYYCIKTKSFQATEGVIEVDAQCYSGDDDAHGEVNVFWWYQGTNDFSFIEVGSPNRQRSRLYDKVEGDYAVLDDTTNYKPFQEWYKIKVVFTGSSAKVYIDDSLWLQDDSMTGSRVSNYLGLSCYTSTDYYDNFRVRKYTEPEPSVSVGGEETP